MAKNNRWSELTSIFERAFGEVQNEGSEQIQVNCPKCQEREGLDEPDGKFNLEINLRRKKFRCWKCDDPFFSGSKFNDFAYLLRTSPNGTPDDIQEYKEYLEANFELDDEEISVVDIVELPQEFIPFSKMDSNNPRHVDAFKFVTIERKIDQSVIDKFNLGFCLDGRFKDRIIIPSYDARGKLNYFVGRTFANAKPPYDNPQASKDAIIFNEGHIDWDATVNLVEGPFDFLSYPVNTIPMLGKVIGKKLFFALNEKKPNIIIILDPDAWKNAIKLYDQIQSLYYDCLHKVKIVELNVVGKNNKGKEVKYDLDEIKRYKGVETVVAEIRKARQLEDVDYLNIR